MRRSVEREIEIIGEAVNKTLKIQADIEISATRKIIAQRNLLAHAYDTVDDGMIWNVVVNHLPLLKQEVEKLLGEVS